MSRQQMDTARSAVLAATAQVQSAEAQVRSNLLSTPLVRDVPIEVEIDDHDPGSIEPLQRNYVYARSVLNDPEVQAKSANAATVLEQSQHPYDSYVTPDYNEVTQALGTEIQKALAADHEPVRARREQPQLFRHGAHTRQYPLHLGSMGGQGVEREIRPVAIGVRDGATRRHVRAGGDESLRQRVRTDERDVAEVDGEALRLADRGLLGVLGVRSATLRVGVTRWASDREFDGRAGHLPRWDASRRGSEAEPPGDT